MEWQNCLNEFIAYLSLEKNASPHTIKAYRHDLNKLRNFLKNTTDPLKVRSEDIDKFLNHLKDSGQHSRSRARKLSAIKSFYKFLQYHLNTEYNPVDVHKGPKLGRYLPETLHIEEIEEIIGAIDHSTPHGIRNRAIVETLYGCGLRVSELINLEVNDLLFEEDLIRVIGKGSKQRLVPVGKVAQKHIKIYISTIRSQQDIDPGSRSILFLNRRGKKLSREMIFMIVRDLAKEAGIDKKVSPHVFRHSFATHLIEGGADLVVVQQMLGHCSLTTTEIYTHLDMQYLRETILTSHPLYK